MPKTEPKSGALSAVTAWIALLWLIEACDILLTKNLHPTFASSADAWSGGWLDAVFGIRPLTWEGLLRIPTAPLMHANLAHLAANSVALFLLGWPSWRYSPKLTMAALGYGVVYGGILAWTLGDLFAEGATCHVGASGVAFALIGFLIGNALFRGGCLPMLLGLATAVLFAGALPQVLPGAGGEVRVSWQMHLGGLLGGLSASWHLRSEKR